MQIVPQKLTSILLYCIQKSALKMCHMLSCVINFTQIAKYFRVNYLK